MVLAKLNLIFATLTLLSSEPLTSTNQAQEIRKIMTTKISLTRYFFVNFLFFLTIFNLFGNVEAYFFAFFFHLKISFRMHPFPKLSERTMILFFYSADPVKNKSLRFRLFIIFFYIFLFIRKIFDIIFHPKGCSSWLDLCF